MARAVTALALLIATAHPARAQDSVASSAGLAGDAVNPYGLGGILEEQVNNYVLHLSPRTSSWGNRFVLGPLAKASRSNASGYFNFLIGAQAASDGFLPTPFLRSSYSTWSSAGPGVGAIGNTTPASRNTAGLVGNRFTAAFCEFASGTDLVFGTNDDEQDAIVTIIDTANPDPNTLFVSRINALSNKPGNGQTASASLGLGAIDELGNLLVLADGYGTTTTNRLTQKSLVRVRATARDVTLVNRLQNTGFDDAPASALVRATDTAMSVPALIPESTPNGAARPVALALDLASNFIHESALNTTTATKSYLPSSTGSVRGSLGFIDQPFVPLTGGGGTGIGLCAALARTDANTTTRAIQLWGVSNVGAPLNQLQIILPTNPALLTDPADNFSPGASFAPLSAHEFTNYGSQLPFRGGASQVASAVLPNGNLLLAALVSPVSGSKSPQSQDDYLAVATITPASAVSWSVAAHTGTAAGFAGGLSKAILGDNGADGIPNTADPGENDGVLDATPIGRLAKASEVFANSVTGPSISSPSMDRAGNLYFSACVALNGASGPTLTTALLKANRALDGSYRLELLLRLGDILPGADSTRNYQVQFLGVSDFDSGDSGAIFSSNIVRQSLPGVPLATLPPGSPMSLGALVFRARIVYDFNNDGMYVDPSLISGSTSPDQAYNVMMILMPRVLTSDFNRSGATDADDLFAFLDAWFAQDGQTGTGLSADFTSEGIVDADDLFAFLDAWFAGV